MRSLQGWVLRHSMVLQPSVGAQPEYGLEVYIPVLWDACGFGGERKGWECGKQHCFDIGNDSFFT